MLQIREMSRSQKAELSSVESCFRAVRLGLRAKNQKSLSNTASFALGCFRFSAATCRRTPQVMNFEPDFL